MFRRRLIQMMLLFVLLVACACGPGEPTAGPAEPTHTPVPSSSVSAPPAMTPSPTAAPPAAIATAAPPPADTPAAPTARAREPVPPGALRITILYDNIPYDPRLQEAWGFAALIEYRGHTLLFDTGGDPNIFVGNMDQLGIDPARIEAIVLSHSHGDHTEGLPGLAARGIYPPVYIPPSFPARFRSRFGGQYELIDVTPGQELSDGIFTTGEMLNQEVWVYEQALAISTSQGLVIVTGCAHPGIIEIVTQAQEMFDAPVHLVLGGFHLVDKSRSEIEAIIDDFRRLGVERAGATHCTGELAISMFAEAYGDDFVQAGAGRVIVIEEATGTAVPPAQGSLGDTWIRPADGMVLLYVPAGEFEMGSDDPEVDAALEMCNAYYGFCERDWFEVEQPVHSVALDGFWIDRTEVTNAQYRRCVEAGACNPPARDDSDTRQTYYGDDTYDDYPVVHVTWNHASAYCAWAGGRLPTEAEWEYAARGPEGWRYPWGDEYDGTRLNSCDVHCTYNWAEETFDDGHADTAPVGSYPEGASWCGAMDLAGNVWEWMADRFGEYPSERQINPTGPSTGSARALRGDAADGTRSVSRCAARHGMAPSRTYAYTGFRCVMPPSRPPSSSPTASTWPTSTPEEQGMDSQILADMLHKIQDQQYPIDSVLVVRHGYLVVDAYVHPFHPDTKHVIHSCTKSVVSALIGIAIDQGYIDGVDQRVLDLFPGRTVANLDADKEAMTLEHVLMMATGLECRDSYLYRWHGLQQMRASADWVQFVLDLPMAEAPGTRFEYCNGASFLLSAILQERTGMSALSFAQQQLFTPLGISDLEWPANPQGITIGWGDLRMRPHDMAKIGYLYLNEGRWDGQQIVPPDWVRVSTRKHIEATLQDGYGYQWWVTDSDIYMALGYAGQFIFVSPEKDLVAVFTSDLEERDFYVPQELLGAYIIPAAKSDQSLPANPDGVARLQAYTEALSQP